MTAHLRIGVFPESAEFDMCRRFLEWQGVQVKTMRVSRLVGSFMEVVIDGKVVLHGFWELVNYWQEKGLQRV